MKTRSVYHLPLSSLQWLLSGLFLAALPLWFQLSPLVLLCFLGCLGWRFALERKGLKCPRIWMRLAVGIGGLAGLILLHGTLLGLTAGMGLLLLLIALKLLEMRTEREFLLLSFLGFFINLTALFFAQSLLVCLYVGVVFLVLLAGVVHFNSGAAEGYRFSSLLRYSMSLIFQATPLILVLFFLLPRVKGGFLLRLNKSNFAQTGMSDQINPGSFAELALSDEIAFRVDFPDGNMPSSPNLYWRVAVMEDCQGLAWRKNPQMMRELEPPKISGTKVVQRISMEPHTGRWVYALDRPIQADGPTIIDYGNCVVLKSETSDRPPPIRVVSSLGNDRSVLSPAARGLLTKVPDNVSERTWQLVDGWRAQTADPKLIVQLALRFFHNERFRYTLTPGSYGNNGLDDFLFERRQGFCEHYAAAFATLMRLANIPSRMVAGYYGGEYNPFGSHLTVRQSDAHAWVELWLNKEEGWVRYDPTEAIDPTRVDPDTDLASRQGVGVQSSLSESPTHRKIPIADAILRTLRFGWDTVNYEWNLWVLGYDMEMQRNFYLQLGIHRLFSWKLISMVLGGILVAVAMVWLWVRQSGEKADVLLHLYRKHCEIFARAGFPRSLSEGPSDYSLRLTKEFPALTEPIQESFACFNEARYHSHGGVEMESRLRKHSLEIQALVAKTALSSTKVEVR